VRTGIPTCAGGGADDLEESLFVTRSLRDVDAARDLPMPVGVNSGNGRDDRLPAGLFEAPASPVRAMPDTPGSPPLSQT